MTRRGKPLRIVENIRKAQRGEGEPLLVVSKHITNIEEGQALLNKKILKKSWAHLVPAVLSVLHVTWPPLWALIDVGIVVVVHLHLQLQVLSSPLSSVGVCSCRCHCCHCHPFAPAALALSRRCHCWLLQLQMQPLLLLLALVKRRWWSSDVVTVSLRWW